MKSQIKSQVRELVGKVLLAKNSLEIYYATKALTNTIIITILINYSGHNSGGH